MLTHLEIIRQFDESAVLPRTPESVRHARVGARDTLCEGFEAVLGAYESAPFVHMGITMGRVAEEGPSHRGASSPSGATTSTSTCA